MLLPTERVMGGTVYACISGLSWIYISVMLVFRNHSAASDDGRNKKDDCI